MARNKETKYPNSISKSEAKERYEAYLSMLEDQLSAKHIARDRTCPYGQEGAAAEPSQLPFGDGGSGKAKTMTKFFADQGVRYIRDDNNEMLKRIRKEKELEYIREYNKANYARINITVSSEEDEEIRANVERRSFKSISSYLQTLCELAGKTTSLSEIAAIRIYQGLRVRGSVASGGGRRICLICSKDDLARYKEDAAKKGFKTFARYIHYLTSEEDAYFENKYSAGDENNGADFAADGGGRMYVPVSAISVSGIGSSGD